jgi:hypothetical protein
MEKLAPHQKAVLGWYMDEMLAQKTYKACLPPARLTGKQAWSTYSDTFGLTEKEIAKLNNPKKDYNTIGVRFIYGENLEKVYTYRIRKGAKVHLGQELIAPSAPTPDSLRKSVVVVVRIDKKPTDTGNYDYKYIEQKVAPL